MFTHDQKRDILDQAARGNSSVKPVSPTIVQLRLRLGSWEQLQLCAFSDDAIKSAASQVSRSLEDPFPFLYKLACRQQLKEDIDVEWADALIFAYGIPCPESREGWLKKGRSDALAGCLTASPGTPAQQPRPSYIPQAGPFILHFMPTLSYLEAKEQVAAIQAAQSNWHLLGEDYAARTISNLWARVPTPAFPPGPEEEVAPGRNYVPRKLGLI